MFSELLPIADIDVWHFARLRQSARPLNRRQRALTVILLRELRDLELVWSISRECEDFRLFWNNRDDPSRANFLFHGLNQANELRPAQGYCGWEADILGTTASLGLDGVIRLDHLHGARRP